MKQGLQDAGIYHDVWYERHHWGYFLYGFTPNTNEWVSIKFAGNGSDPVDLEESVIAFKEFLKQKEEQ